MTYSEQSQGYVAYAVQSALGTEAVAGNGKILLTTGGKGSQLTKASVESATIRRDGMSLRGRHGTRKTAGAYSSELFMGQFDDIIEAVMRGTWGTADLAIAAADVTSITTTANTIVAASGSWITLGLHVGDVVRLSGSATAANNGRNIRISGLTASTITTPDTLTLDATPDTGFTLTRPGKVLSNPASLTKRYFTLEEHELDIDSSEVFQDCVWGSIKFAMAPNGNVLVDTTTVGTGQMDALTGASAPYFTSPTEITDVPLAATGATVYLGTGDLLDLTSFDITVDIQPAAPDVIAPPSNPYAPDVFAGSVMVSMNLTMLRKDLAAVSDFIDETQQSLLVTFAKDGGDPGSDFLSLYVPNFTFGSVDKSALSKQGGPRTVTIAVPAALVGVDTRGGAFESTMIKFQSTAA